MAHKQLRAGRQMAKSDADGQSVFPGELDASGPCFIGLLNDDRANERPMLTGTVTPVNGVQM